MDVVLYFRTSQTTGQSIFSVEKPKQNLNVIEKSFGCREFLQNLNIFSSL